MKTCLLVFCVLVYHLGIAQKRPLNQEPKLDYEGMNLRMFLQKKAKYPSEFHRELRMAITLAKFKVSKAGKIDTVYLSRGTDKAIRVEINNAFKKTNGYWTPKIRNGQPVESDTYLLPLQYKIEHINGDEYNLEKDYYETLEQFPNLFDFQEGSNPSVSQFIILEPVVFFGTTPIR